MIPGPPCIHSGPARHCGPYASGEGLQTQLEVGVVRLVGLRRESQFRSGPLGLPVRHCTERSVDLACFRPHGGGVGLLLYLLCRSQHQQRRSQHQDKAGLETRLTRGVPSFCSHCRTGRAQQRLLYLLPLTCCCSSLVYAAPFAPALEWSSSPL